MSAYFFLKYLTNERPLVKGGRIVSCNAVYYRFCDKKQSINIIINDSLHVINMPLRSFGKSFKFDVEK